MLTEIHIAKLRADALGVGPDRAHFNHAGASLMARGTMACMQAHYQLEAELGAMEAGAIASAKLHTGRADFAALIGAKPHEIALCNSGSQAFGLAFAALPTLKCGDRILVARQEWGGNLANYQRAAHAVGAHVEVMPCLEDGRVDVVALANQIDARVRLLSVTWLPANGGLINPAAEIGKLARAANIPYLIDAGQALGQLPIDVEALGCDILKSAGRKHLRGPRGTALLYVRETMFARMQPCFLSVSSAQWRGDGFALQTDARRFECAELHSALGLGLLEAAKAAIAIDLNRAFARTQALAGYLRGRLKCLQGLRLHDLGSAPHSGIVSFTLDGKDSFAIQSALRASGYTLGANGAAYTPLDMQARQLDSVLRASLSFLNTVEECDCLVQEIAQLLCLGGANK